MHQKNKGGETTALEILRQISNQDTNYNWCKPTRNNNFTDLSKCKSTLEHLSKPIKLPNIIKKKNFDNFQSGIIKYRSTKKQKPTSIRNFFKSETPNLIKFGCSKLPQQQQQNQNKNYQQLQIVKFWLTRKKIQCKSLNNIINKFKDDSGKYKYNHHSLALSIKSFN